MIIYNRDVETENNKHFLARSFKEYVSHKVHKSIGKTVCVTQMFDNFYHLSVVASTGNKTKRSI